MTHNTCGRTGKARAVRRELFGTNCLDGPCWRRCRSPTSAVLDPVEGWKRKSVSREQQIRWHEECRSRVGSVKTLSPSFSKLSCTQLGKWDGVVCCRQRSAYKGSSIKYVRKKIGNSAPLLQGVLFLTPPKYVRFCTPPPPPRERTRKRTAMNVIDRMFSDSAGLRHKLSKLQLRAPGYPKGPPCIQRGPQKEKTKKTKKERKKERKSSKVRIARKSLQLPPSNLRTSSTTPPPRNRAGNRSNYPPSNLRTSSTTPLEIGPENRSNYPPSNFFSGYPFLLFSSLGPHTGLIRPCFRIFSNGPTTKNFVYYDRQPNLLNPRNSGIF